MLMQAIDGINARMGAGTLSYADAGPGQGQRRRTVFSNRSPAYTTNRMQLPMVG